MEDLSTEAKLCSEQGNAYPTCSPTISDTWKNGSTHDFIWNWNFPYYVTADTLNLYMYYYIKYEYIPVKTFSNLNRSIGGFEVTVDDSWFLSKSEKDQNLTIYGYFLPSTLNNTEELTNIYSMYPRPFNFTVTQIATPSNSTNSTTTNGPSSSSTPSNTTSQNSASSSSSNLPGWAIAVIVIACIAFICGVAALVWTFLLSRRNKKNNKLIPIFGQNNSNSNNNNSNHGRGIEAALTTTGVMSEKSKYDTLSLNSQAKMMAFRSSESVGENASSVKTYIQHEQPIKMSSTDTVMLPDTFRNTLNRSVSDWEEDPEVRRRRLGEALLQRQLEEDGTFVQNAGRLTRVKSLTDIPKSAVFEQPKY